MTATRLLRSDIPQRALFGACEVWVYRDPSGATVGFGSCCVTDEYRDFVGGTSHVYIPLLAVHPEFERRGHGSSIVEHLTGEGVKLLREFPNLADMLFLDVYTANERAIKLYQRCEFDTLNPDTPIADPDEQNQTYVVMGRRLSG